MKKRSKSKSAVVPRVDPYIDGLMAKLLERLVSLEKKMDMAVAQTSGRLSGNGGQPKSVQIPQPQQPRRDRILYEAICADCHKVCEVPFKPSEDRAVYCKECFARRKSLPAGRQAAGQGKPFLALTPVALSPKPVSKLSAAAQTASPPRRAPIKVKKSPPAKKAKKKK